MKRLHGEPLVPVAGRPLQARLELFAVRAAGAERVARPLRVHAFGNSVEAGSNGTPKKKGQPHANLAGTGPELCGREEAR